MCDFKSAVSNKEAWLWMDTAEKGFRVLQYSAGFILALRGTSQPPLRVAQLITTCVAVRRCVSAGKFVRDIAWLSSKDVTGTRHPFGTYFKSTLIKGGKNVEGFHYGCLGKQVAIFPVHLIAFLGVGELANLYRLPPICGTLSKYAWLTAMTCECGNQWSHAEEERFAKQKDRHLDSLHPTIRVSPHPYGLMGSSSEAALAMFEVALAGVVPKWATSALGIWTGMYWLWCCYGMKNTNSFWGS